MIGRLARLAFPTSVQARACGTCVSRMCHGTCMSVLCDIQMPTCGNMWLELTRSLTHECTHTRKRTRCQVPSGCRLNSICEPQYSVCLSLAKSVRPLGTNSFTQTYSYVRFHRTSQFSLLKKSVFYSMRGSEKYMKAFRKRARINDSINSPKAFQLEQS